MDEASSATSLPVTAAAPSPAPPQQPQATMSGTAGYGYGICGHKNTYCCGVMNGNYVEDQYGRDLAKMETRWEAFVPQSTSQSRILIRRTWSTAPATRTSSSRIRWMTSEVVCRRNCSSRMMAICQLGRRRSSSRGR